MTPNFVRCKKLLEVYKNLQLKIMGRSVLDKNYVSQSGLIQIKSSSYVEP